MGKAYQVLLIEDDESDADLIRSQLNRLDIELKLDLLNQENQLIERLHNDPPDLIISDYNLPSFTGINALKIVRKRDAHLPFILISGCIGEEKAVDAMLEGASDVVVKDNLDRLAPAVKREIQAYGEQKREERQLEDSHDRYQSLVQTLDGIIWEADADSFVFSYVSPQTKNILGYDPDEWVGTPKFWQERIHPDDRKEVIEFCKDQTQKGENHSFEYRIRKADGTYIWLHDVVTVKQDGESVTLRGVMMDISETKQAQQERQKAEVKYRTVVEQSTNMFYQHDRDGILTYLSPQSQNFLGYAPEEAKCKWTAFTTEHPANKIGMRRTQKALDTGERQPPYELEIETGDGRIIWVEVNEAPLKENGKVVGMAGSLTDITERKRYEEELEESLERYNYVTKATRDVIYDWDISKDHLYWGEGLKKLFGHEIDEGKYPLEKYAELVHPDDANQVWQDLEKTLQSPSENHWEYEYRLQKSDDSFAHVIENGYIIRNGDGQATRMIGAIRDVTEQHELEELLEQSQKMAGIGAWEIDRANEEIYWSPVTKQIHEVDQDFKPDFETAINFYKEGKSRETIRKVVQVAIEKGKSWDVELQIVTARGNERWVRAKGEPEMTEGRCTRLYGSFQDIHARKMAEINMREAYAKRRKILERINEAFFAVDTEWNVTYWNQQAENKIGVTRKEVIGKNLWEKFPAAKDRKFFSEYQRALDEQVSVQFEEYYPPLEQWLEVNAYPSEEGLSVFFRDITERKAAAEKIKRANKKLKMAQEIAHLGYWEMNLKTEEIYWSDQAYRIWEYDPEDTQITFEMILERMHPDDREYFLEQNEKTLTNHVPLDMEHRILLPDGSVKWLHVMGTVKKDQNGEPLTLEGSVQDITKRKKAHQQLEKLNTKLEQRAEELAASNAELEQFAYVASHDLQEPLRMVSSFLKRLEKKYGDELDDKARQYIDFAVDGARRMRRIIMDLLNYSRVGQDQFERESLRPDDLLEEVVKLERSAIEESGANLQWDALPAIHAAQTPIQQVFRNLISNALKYHQPEISPKIQIKGEETETHWKFSVSDNGIGIREEFQENIFTIFQRLHTQEEYSGTGIGLAVSKKIVERHGGEIWVESTEGEGSTFYFTIAK